MKKFAFVFLCFFVVGAFGMCAYADVSENGTADIDLRVGIGILSGDTTYQIGGTVVVPEGTYEIHFPLSELKFPLDTYIVSLGGGIEFLERWKASLDVQKNISDETGDMEDSDWLTLSNPGRLDVFSTSETDLDVLIWDVNLKYKFYKGPDWSFSAGLGYIRQDFDFECRVKEQWSPSSLPGYNYTGDGTVGLTYDITYDIPYIEIGTQFKKDRFGLELSLGYSPIVNVEDEDHHILRNKVSTGDLDGDAVLFSMEGRYDITKNWYLALGINYTLINTDGEQNQYTDGVWTAIVDEETESEQIYAVFSVGFVF